MRRAHPSKVIAQDDETDSIILSVKLRLGRFEATMECPLDATDAERQRFVESWLQMVESGIAAGRESRERKAREALLDKGINNNEE